METRNIRGRPTKSSWMSGRLRTSAFQCRSTCEKTPHRQVPNPRRHEPRTCLTEVRHGEAQGLRELNSEHGQAGKAAVRSQNQVLLPLHLLAR